MPLQDDLERLEDLVLRGGFDEESREQVKSLRRRFEKAVAAEELAKHSAVAPYIQYLKDEIVRCKEILSEDDTLDEKARNKYFERKRACQDFLSHFGDTGQIAQTIKQLLDVAKNS
jgi:hypothetical protein